MLYQNTVTIATSIAPANIKLQIEATKSWEGLGFNIVSVNTGEEIENLQKHFDTINFVEANRDASSIAGKPFIYLDDILLTLEKTGSRVCGIINSDIFLSANSDFSKYVADNSRNAFIFGSRIDVDSFNDLDGEEYYGGFDYFFFDKAIISLYHKTDFCLGLPWWDFWVPLVPIIKGIPVRRLVTPVAYHIRHRQNWWQQFFEDYGRNFVAHLLRDDLSKSLDEELKACFSYVDEPEITNFCKCILNYLKNIPEHIFYTDPHKLETKAVKNVARYNSMRNSSGDCDRAKQKHEETLENCTEELQRSTLICSVENKTNQEMQLSHSWKTARPLFIGESLISARSSKERVLKVAFFTSHPANVGSGSERLIYNTVKALIERGHDARVYVMNANLDKEPPFFVHQMPKMPMERLFERVHSKVTGWIDFLFPSTALLRLRKWIRSADLWHLNNVHGHFLSIPLLSLASWTKRIIISPVDQYLSTGHCPYTMGCGRFMVGCGSCERLDEPWPGISRDSTRAMWRVKRLSILNSRFNMMFHTQALADHYAKTFVRCRPSKVLQYGVDINCFRPLPRADCAQKLGVEPSSRFVIGLLHSYVLEPRKGILSIVKRLGDLAQQFPGQIGLLIVGHGSHVVRDIVPPELSLTILPYLRHPHELANALNLCDVLLYPTQAENLSLSCLSALACGVPVISYDAGGQKEAIKNGLNGFIVDIKDIEGMIAAVVEMIKDPSLCQRLSEGARSTAEEYFDFDRYIDELIEYYYEIIKAN